MRENGIHSTKTSASSQQPMSYPKDSFDRFDDGLHEVIISYLWLEDKFRYRCLSRRWSRLAFRRQWRMTVDCSEIVEQYGNNFCEYVQKLKTKLAYCPNIRTTRIYFSEEMYDQSCWLVTTITDHCTDVSSFVCDSLYAQCNHCLDKFFTKFGKTLKSLKIINEFEHLSDVSKILSKCPNLEVLIIDTFFDGIDWQNISFPRLNKFKINKEEVVSKLSTMNCFLKNHPNMISLEFGFCCRDNDPVLYNEECVTLLETVSQLRHLTSLKLIFSSDVDVNNDILEALKLVGHRCPQLRCLRIEFYALKSNDNLAMFLPVLRAFGQLTQLTLAAILPGNSPFELKSQTFSCLPQLTHLEIDLGNKGKYSDFFVDMTTHLPRLKRLKICKFGGFKQRKISQLLRPSALRSLTLGSTQDHLQSCDFAKELTQSRPKLEVILQ